MGVGVIVFVSTAICAGSAGAFHAAVKRDAVMFGVSMMLVVCGIGAFVESAIRFYVGLR